MAWDDEKEVAPGTEQGELTPDEWNEHVADQKSHSERHESGGIDELTVEGLTGDLADAQDPKAEVTRDIVDAFLDAGTNVTVSRDADTLTIDTTALNDQEVADKIGAVVEGGSQTTVTYDSGTQTATITIDAPTQAAFDDHSTRHESGGGDELSVTGLSGDLADEQDAKPHDIGGETHTADTLANLNSKVSDATLDDSADPREPETHAATHEGGSDSLNVFNLTGDLVGEGLERVNDTLQVLSSIWDGANVVADVNNTNTTTQTLEAEEVNTERIGSDRHYASNDSDLDAILTNVSDGDKILLGNSDFEEDRTFSDRVSIEGIAGENRGTTISGTWTIQSRGGRVDNIGFIGSDGGLVIDTDRVVVSRVRIGPGVIDVKDDECILSMLVGGSVTFESGTSDGIVDSSTGVSVTDNGNNTVGDIA